MHYPQKYTPVSHDGCTIVTQYALAMQTSIHKYISTAICQTWVANSIMYETRMDMYLRPVFD